MDDPLSFSVWRDEQKNSFGKILSGLIREGYYRKLGAKIPKPEPGEDTVDYDAYGWSEHISRKYARQAASVRLKVMLAEKGIIL